MARPLVLIFQDLQPTSVEPQTPDLNSVIAGPAYVLKDYPDDAATILLPDAYGALEQPAGGADVYVPPLANVEAARVVAYPDNAAGAVVDKASVRLFLQNPHVVVGSTHGVGPGLGTAVTTSATVGLENRISFTGGADLVAADVKVGDRVILTDSAGVTEVRVVMSVGEPDSSGAVTDAAKLRVSENMPATGWTFDASGEARVERTLPNAEYVDAVGDVITFPFAGQDTLVINGGIELTVDGVALPLSFAGLYVAYRALRQDLAGDVDFVTQSDVLVDAAGRTYFAALGIVDARNPLAAGVFVALQNAGAAPIYYVGVQANDAGGHAAVRTVTESRGDLHTFVPLTADLSVIGAYKLEWEQLADPTFAQENGVPQKFRMVIGNTTLPVNSTVAPASSTGVSAQPTTALNTNLYRTLNLTGSPSIDVTQVLAGDRLTIGIAPLTGTWGTRRGAHTVAHVNSSQDVPTSATPSIELLPGSSRWTDGAVDASGPIELLIADSGGNVKYAKLAFAQIDDGTNGVLFTMLAPTTVGGPWTIAYTTGAPTSTPVVAIAGFAVTIQVSSGVTTYNQIVTAVNTHAVLKTLMVASLVGASGPQTGDVPPTALQVSETSRTTTSGGNGVKVVLRNLAPVTPYTIVYVNTGTLSVAVVGSAITVNINAGTTLISAVVAAINAHAAARLIVLATVSGSGAATMAAASVQNISTVASSCLGSVAKNDDLFVWLFDANARFMSNGVKAGDVLQLPVDPNDYSPGAFDGVLYSYTVAQVISENRLAVQTLGDDSPSSDNELPHYFNRHLAGKFIDDDTSGSAAALNYQVVRQLTTDDQVSELIAVAQSLRSKRAVIAWPDLVDVNGLKDGSLPRTLAAVPQAAGSQPGWYVACQLAGALAGLPVQHGLTNLGLAGISKLYHSSRFFREAQLSRLSDGGLCVMHQVSPAALPECIHQLTTDTTALETGEISVVRNVDYVSIVFQNVISPFLGQWNVLPETLSAILTEVNKTIVDLKGRRIARIGAPLTSGEVTLLKISDVSADRIVMFSNINVPKPLNGVDVHLVV